MRSLILFCVLAAFSFPVFAQYPDTDERRKMKVKSIKTNSLIGEIDSKFDVYGQQSEELHAGTLFFSVKYFYNKDLKLDSIESNSDRPHRMYRQYFDYAADSSYILETVFKDYTDTLFTDKDNRKIRQSSSDGSTIKFDYNSKKQLIKETATSSEGLKEITAFFYDAQNRVIRKILTSEPGTVLTTLYTWNAKGKVISTKTTGTGGYSMHSGSSVYLYNINNLLIKESTVRGTIKSSESYTYEFYQ